MEDLVKNSIHTVTIAGYSHDGAGIARVNGKVVFVKNALDGEVCSVKILKSAKSAAYAKIEHIISPSPHRVSPVCPVFGKCGGCGLMHMDYEEELLFKKSRVQDALRRIGGVDIKLEGIVGADEDGILNYRNKAIFAVGTDRSGKTVTGFFRRRSHDIIPVGSCHIQSAQSNSAAEAVRRWMDKYRIPAYDETERTGVVRHVFCRCGKVSGELQVVIVSFAPSLPHTGELIEEIRAACPEVSSIVLNINKTAGNTVLAGEFITLWGSNNISDTLCGIEYSLSPMSFYQINHDQAERLYNAAAEFAALTGRETVLDLYCGTGTITLRLARDAMRIVGAEIVESAVNDARENARRNGVKNTDFICADASRAAKELLSRGLSPDVIVVDPPRKGLAPDVIETIAAMAPDRVVYVSCDPATAARDVKIFAGLGYRTVRALAVDMFPRTSHIESVLLLVREKPAIGISTAEDNRLGTAGLTSPDRQR